MKDSKDKEHRISNLKNMIDNVKEDETSQFDDIEEDSELIDYLNEEPDEFDELEIDDEFIYHPDDDNSSAINLEETPIDEDYLIKAPKTEDNDGKDEIDEIDEYEDDLIGDLSENFDNVINAKIGGKPVLAIVSTIVGVILVIYAGLLFSSRSDRVIDNVVAGETSFTVVIFLAFGILLIFYGLYKLLDLSNPFDGISSLYDDDDDDEKENTEPKKEEPSPKVIPKSEIPLDKESYKIGEFHKEDLKKALKKPTASKKKKTDSKNNPEADENTDNIPPAKEKPANKKGLTSEEIEEMEYEQVILENESIDDIFAEVEDLDDLDIISIDSEEKQEK